MQDLSVIPDPYLNFFDTISHEHRSFEVYGCNEVACIYHLSSSKSDEPIYDFENKNALYRGYPVKQSSFNNTYISFLKEKSYNKAVMDGMRLKNYCPEEHFTQLYKASAESVSINNLLDIMYSYDYVSFDFFGTLVYEKSSFQKRVVDYCAMSEEEAKEFSFTLDFERQTFINPFDTGSRRLTDYLVHIPKNIGIFNQIQARKIILSDCLEDIRDNYLELTGLPHYILSYEAGMTKANGGLYSKLPKNSIHFGDNFLVDGLMANKNMVDSIIFDDTGYYFSKCK